jgi:DNA-binding response OmpR family regulator
MDAEGKPITILYAEDDTEDQMLVRDALAGGFIVKPVTFDKLTELMKILGKYWFEIVELPPQN